MAIQINQHMQRNWELGDENDSPWLFVLYRRPTQAHAHGRLANRRQASCLCRAVLVRTRWPWWCDLVGVEPGRRHGTPGPERAASHGRTCRQGHRLVSCPRRDPGRAPSTRRDLALDAASLPSKERNRGRRWPGRARQWPMFLPLQLQAQLYAVEHAHA